MEKWREIQQQKNIPLEIPLRDLYPIGAKDITIRLTDNTTTTILNENLVLKNDGYDGRVNFRMPSKFKILIKDKKYDEARKMGEFIQFDKVDDFIKGITRTPPMRVPLWTVALEQRWVQN